MTKKKVTAPLTYNPGKNRPKEHLAYLNYQEMQALKRLNGNNQERGPKGLPSFPPADSRSGSYNSGYGSAASKTTSKTTTKSPSSATASISRTTSNVARSPASQGSPVSQRPTSGPLSAPARTAPSQGSPVSQRTTTPTRQGSPVSQRPSGGARDSGQAAARSDTAFKQAAERQSAASARSTPALRQDQSKTISAGPMGIPVRSGVPSQQAQRIVPRATITTPMATQGVSFTSPIDARRSIAFAGQTRVPSVSEIAAENARRLNAAKAAQYSAQMAQQYSQYRSPPGTYPTAPQGVFGPRAGEGTGYLRTADMPGMITTGTEGMPSARFAPRYNAESTLRAYEEAKRLSPKIQDRVPVGGELTVGRSAVVPSYPTAMPESGLYKRPGRDPAVERALAEAGYDPTGRRLEPMIDPSIPGRLVSKRGPAQVAPPLRWQPGERMLLPGYREAIQDPNVLRSPIPRPERPVPPGFGAETPATTMPSLAEAGQRLYDAFTGAGSAITGAVTGGINALANINLRPGSVISTDEGLKIVNPDKTLSPYSAERERVIKMMSPDYQYQTPVDPALSRFPKSPSLPSMPPPTGEESVVKASGLPAIPVPQSMGMLAPPKPKLRPADLRRPESYRGIDGTTEEDIGGSFEEGDASATSESAIGPRSFLNLYNEGLPPGYAERYGLDQERVLEVETVPEAEQGPRSGMTEDQRKEAQKSIRRGNRVAGQFVGTVGGPLGGLAARGGLKLYEKAKLAQLERYAAMTPAEKLAAEKRNPELIGWAKRLGIDSESDYSDYEAWATERGLRAPAGGGKSSGILTLGGGSSGGGTTPAPETPSTPSTPSGRRPDIYYMWDLGVNIPSPSDPNYTQYQAYLAERLAAQQAMGYV